LLKALDDGGLSNDSLVFFSSDNGPETLHRYKGSERSYGSPKPLRGMKLHLYEGGIRVPGIVRWPAKIKAGRTSNQPVGSYDILPTFCAMAGVKAPVDRVLDGTSLLPLFSGEMVSRSKPLYWQYDRAIGGPNRVAMRDGDWKLLANTDLSKFELYNLKTDISEAHDLASAEPSKVAELATEMRRLHAEIKAEAPVWPEGPGTQQ
jgi:arylsulfatase A